MTDVMVEFDSEAELTFFRFMEDAQAVETVELSDDINVALDSAGQVIGIEVLFPPSKIDELMLAHIGERYPAETDAIRAAFALMGRAA